MPAWVWSNADRMGPAISRLALDLQLDLEIGVRELLAVDADAQHRLLRLLLRLPRTTAAHWDSRTKNPWCTAPARGTGPALAWAAPLPASGRHWSCSWMLSPAAMTRSGRSRRTLGRGVLRTCCRFGGRAGQVAPDGGWANAEYRWATRIAKICSVALSARPWPPRLAIRNRFPLARCKVDHGGPGGGRPSPDHSAERRAKPAAQRRNERKSGAQEIGDKPR